MFTLQDARNLSQDKLDQMVIDEFRKSVLMDMLVFDDTVTPGGSSLAYTYNRITTLPTASGRALGTEYVPQEAKTTQKTVILKPFGGSFAIDRVLINYQKQIVDLVQFQVGQKTKAATALFADWFINGDSAVDPLQFDGLDIAVTGSSTELTGVNIDLSSATAVKQNWQDLLYAVRQAIKRLDGEPSIIGVNRDMFAVFQSVADQSTQFTQTKSELGSSIVKYGNAAIVDLGDKPGTSDPVIPTSADGKTDIYFARIGLDGVHGVSPEGNAAPKVYLPNMEDPKAVKEGAVEMVTAAAIKASRAAGALRGVQVAQPIGG